MKEPAASADDKPSLSSHVLQLSFVVCFGSVAECSILRAFDPLCRPPLFAWLIAMGVVGQICPIRIVRCTCAKSFIIDEVLLQLC
jgi:hypothetical protein